MSDLALGDPRVATLTVMRGEMDRLPGLMANLQFASEKHLVETGDAAAHVAEAYPAARVHHCPLPLGSVFDAARGAALGSIQADWIWVVDTDERIPEALRDWVLGQLDGWKIAGVEAVSFARLNHVLGQPLRHSSAWPDRQLRLFRKGAASFSNRIHGFAPEHLKAVRQAPSEEALAIHHYNFETTRDFVTKLNLYSSIEAEQAGRERPASLWQATYRAAREFAARYVKMQGYKDGAAGFHYAAMLAVYKYLIESKRWEVSRK